jgi:RNA polymerase-binding transcription factor
VTADVTAVLAAERSDTQARIETMSQEYANIVAASADANADDEHDPEGSTIAFERAQLGALLEQARRHLADLDLAVERVATGSYAMCENCGGAIPFERLEARPAARTCIDCARSMR